MGRVFVLSLLRCWGKLKSQLVAKCFQSWENLERQRCVVAIGMLVLSVYFSPFLFFLAYPSVLSFYINIYICQRPLKD